MTKLFLDTNFFLDILNASRERHLKSQLCLNYFLENDIKLYTSSDIISTISYFLQKKLAMNEVVKNIDYIVQEVTILTGDNSDFITLNQLIFHHLEKNDLKIDYEDCMQLYLAEKYGCDTILTSDKQFCQGLHRMFNVGIESLDDCMNQKNK